MGIQQISESVTVTRTYRIEGAEPIPLSFRSIEIIPQSVKVVFVDGKWTRLDITGPRAKKDGSPGETSHDSDYTPDWRTSGIPDDMPEWAHPLTAFEQTDDDMANAQRVAEGS